MTDVTPKVVTDAISWTDVTSKHRPKVADDGGAATRVKTLVDVEDIGDGGGTTLTTFS